MEKNFFYQYIFLIPIIAFIISVILKMIISKIFTGKFDVRKALSSGGMPSSHSATVVSLATAIALRYGIDHGLFATVFVFTFLTIVDATNLRFEAGLHAKAINKYNNENLNERLGHYPKEAFAGSIVGFLVAYIIYLF